MKVLGLDKKTYTWNISGYQVLLDDERKRSQLHKDIKTVIKEVFPTFVLLEEVALPGSFGLYADFFLPKQKLMVEANGKQHYEFVEYFHGDRESFRESKKRDSNKKQWCNLNGFYFVEIPYWETKDEWRKRIRSYYES